MKILISKEAKVFVKNNYLSLKIENQILNPDNMLMVAEMDDILSFLKREYLKKK